jgi:agmatine deiminase
MSGAKSPASLGYRCPAEWEPQRGVWLAWPAEDSDDFSGIHREPVLDAYGELIETLLPSVPVYLNNGKLAATSDRITALRKNFGDRLRLLDIPSSEWCRDFGPTFLLDSNGNLGAVDWGFSVWGGKYGPTFSHDANATCRMAASVGACLFESSDGISLEGGAIDVNGAGAVLTTKCCLLHENRNSGLTQESAAQHLRDFLGVEQVIWLDGSLEGDDTDGHIDTMARFVAETSVVLQSFDPDDTNHGVFEQNLERLRSARLSGNRHLHVTLLPSPGRIAIDGIRMPASYANFMITNNLVLVPAYGSDQDAQALEILQSCFPDRTGISIDCSHLIWGRGALHCISQQLPASASNDDHLSL